MKINWEELIWKIAYGFVFLIFALAFIAILATWLGG